MPQAIARSQSAKGAAPAIRRIGLADIPAALREGWQDFMAAPTQLVFLALIYPIVGLLAARTASGGDMLPLFWPLVAGLALLGPVLALGLYEISRRREHGQAPHWRAGLDVVASPAMAGLLVPAIFLLALFVAWVATAQWLWHRLGAGMPAPQGLLDLAGLMFSTPQGHRLLLWGNLVGAGFAALAFAGTALTFPLLLDRPLVEPGTAMMTSLRAIMLNPLPMALWGLTIAGLLVLGSLPLFVGLAVVMPWLGHATWHMYRRAVG